MSGPATAAGGDADRTLEASIPDPVAQNISDILELESREGTTRAQLWLERLSRWLARPAFPWTLLVFIATWVAINLTSAARFDPPPFVWLTGLLTLVALLMTTIVLIGQGRQSTLAKQRAHLDLQINLLTEQKVTKLIHLIEELRADLPGVRARHDPHVSELKKPTDPAQLASALKDRDARSESATSRRNKE